MQRWQAFNAEFMGAFAAGMHMDTRQAGALFAREARRQGFIAGSHDYSAFYAQAMHAYREIACKIADPGAA